MESRIVSVSFLISLSVSTDTWAHGTGESQEKNNSIIDFFLYHIYCSLI